MENGPISKKGKKFAKKIEMALGPKWGKMAHKWRKKRDSGSFFYFFAIFSPFRAEGHFLFFGHFFPFLDIGPFSILC